MPLELRKILEGDEVEEKGVGGGMGFIGTIHCYNCDKEGHVGINFLLPRRPWCS